jgi:hypothetical protein
VVLLLELKLFDMLPPREAKDEPLRRWEGREKARVWWLNH